MARAMWKGAIQFGLVTIPVKLYVATESRAGVSFNMLHATDLSRIQMKIFCPVEEEVISRSDTVKGFEYAPGEYVVITDEDLESLPLKTVRSIEIEQFVETAEAETHTRFVKQAYYIEPDKIGRKAFGLLKSVLQDKGLTAICKVVIKDREALAALNPFEIDDGPVDAVLARRDPRPRRAGPARRRTSRSSRPRRRWPSSSSGR